MTSNRMALMTVTGTEEPPSLEAAAGQLGVTTNDIDKAFGVVLIDPQQGLYCVQVRADTLPADIAVRKPYQGPFSDPAIAPFGPVRNK